MGPEKSALHHVSGVFRDQSGAIGVRSFSTSRNSRFGSGFAAEQMKATGVVARKNILWMASVQQKPGLSHVKWR